MIVIFLISKSEGPSQHSYTGTPTKRLSIEVTRIATPPRMSPRRRQSRNGSDEERRGGKEREEGKKTERERGREREEGKKKTERERGKEKERKEGKKTERERGKEREGEVRRSPRKNLKRGRQQTEEEKEDLRRSSKISKSDCSVCGKKNCKCVGETQKAKSDTTKERIEEDLKPKERVMRTKPSKARKAIKYVDESEEEDGDKTGGGGEGNRKEQAVLMSGGSSSSMTYVSPRKPGASPRQQTTPEREGYLVKQPGLTFDKDKSASPVKTPRKITERTQSAGVGVQTPTKPVSTPVKPVSTPVQPVSRPHPPLAKTTTPSSGPRPGSSGGATPTTTPKLSRGSSYRNYMNRAGPKTPGSKVVPKGEENCFEGLTFVITGVLESLEREEAADIVKRYCVTKRIQHSVRVQNFSGWF